MTLQWLWTVRKGAPAGRPSLAVSSTQAAFWAAMRPVGESGHVTGCRRLLEGSTTASVHCGNLV
jgi:hypothetical protein